MLNGGKSTRMGRDKSCMLVGNNSMLDKSVALMHKLALDRVCVSGKAHDIPDITFNKGPVGGIYSAISKMNLDVGDILLVLPNDMPLMEVQLLSDLLLHAKEQKCTCVYEKQPMPVCLFINKNLLVRLKEIEQTEGMSLRYLIEADRVLKLKTSSVKAFTNVNAPEDWLEVKRIIESL